MTSNIIFPGGDAIKNDGIYARYFSQYTGNVYTVKNRKENMK